MPLFTEELKRLLAESPVVNGLRDSVQCARNAHCQHFPGHVHMHVPSWRSVILVQL